MTIDLYKVTPKSQIPVLASQLLWALLTRQKLQDLAKNMGAFHPLFSKVSVRVAGSHPPFCEVLSVAESPTRLPVIAYFLFIISLQLLLGEVVM